MKYITSGRFPLTSADSDYDVLSPDVEDVANLIMDDCQSPYKAWLSVLAINQSELPRLMGVTEAAADFYLQNDKKSPHISNVQLFCESLGIHPAYLQPALREESFNFLYHPSILEAVCEVMVDDRSSREEKGLSYNALQVEQKKFQDFKEKFPQRAEYFSQAFAHFEKFQKQCLSEPSLSGSFKVADFNSYNNVLDKLYFYKDFLDRDVVRMESLMREKALAAGFTYQKLSGLGECLYGEELSDISLEILIDEILEANYGDSQIPESFWMFYKETFLKELDPLEENVDLLDVPPLRPRFHQEMRKQGVLPEETKTLFLEHLPQFMKERALHFKAVSILKQQTKFRDGFDAWLKNADTYSLDIPLYENYILAEKYLKEFRTNNDFLMQDRHSVLARQIEI